MNNTKNISAIVGPTLMAVTASEVMNAHIWVNVSAAQTYLAGALWFIAGLSIIRSYNEWHLNWSLLITIIGWFTTIGGLGRMFFPQAATHGAQNEVVVLGFQLCLFLMGFVLTFKAFKPDKKSFAN